MKRLYRRWMHDWENRLCFRATNRVVRPFEWGLEWTQRWPCARSYPRNGHDPESYLRALNRLAIENSDEFYAYEKPADFALDGRILRFTSAVETPYPENNIVYGQWFPARHKPGAKRCAVVVLPHWNAQATQHNALCAGLARLGISALRISLPYHDYRMPRELERADYAVSANVGRTIDAARQAVIDVRSCADWLEREGFDRIGIVGTSLGSCYAYLASAHDERFRVNVFNHCSTYFADVVWLGLSTRHIREGLEQEIDLDRLREAWMLISPPAFRDRFAEKPKRSLFIYAEYDTTFPPHLSKEVVDHARETNLDHESVVLPCGHYTLGEWPFKLIDGYHICAFLKRNL
jgi:dienelactone hydrolase